VYADDFRHDPASHEAMERVVRLYPANTDGWKRRCLWAGSSGDLREDVRICEKAVEAEPTFPLVVSALGRTQLALGDACAAQKSYEKAVSLNDNTTQYADLESMARAALQCGDLQQAQAGLEAAIKIEEKNRAGQRMYSGNDDDVARRDEEGEMKKRI
jgi:tetratricopeptide (TPR) repeat protein